MGAAGQFDYVVPLQGSASNGWRGRALPPTEARFHPGLVGRQPDLRLSGDLITLTRTEDVSGRLPPEYQHSGPPQAGASFHVGSLLSELVEPDDVLRIQRGGTAEIDLVLSRQRTLVAAFGAIGPFALCDGNSFRVDPRADEVRLYGLRAALEDPTYKFVWLNTSEVDIETLALQVEAMEGDEHLVMAIAGHDEDIRRQLNWRLAESVALFKRRRRSRWYVDVDARFPTQEQWLAYIRQLPQTRPRDLHIDFHLGSLSVALCEGDYGFHAPWHLFVERVYTPGLPGRLSQIAIVRVHPAATRETVMAATRVISSGKITTWPQS